MPGWEEGTARGTEEEATRPSRPSRPWIPVDDPGKSLGPWPSDVHNGVRGGGELLVPFNSAAEFLSNSEVVEAFLYKNTESLPKPLRMRGRGREERRDGAEARLRRRPRGRLQRRRGEWMRLGRGSDRGAELVPGRGVRLSHPRL